MRPCHRTIQIQGTKDQLEVSPTSLTPVKHPSAVVPPVLSAQSRPSVSLAFPNDCTSTASGKRTSGRERMPATGRAGGMCVCVGSKGKKNVMKKKALRLSISTMMPIEHPGRAPAPVLLSLRSEAEEEEPASLLLAHFYVPRDISRFFRASRERGRDRPDRWWDERECWACRIGLMRCTVPATVDSALQGFMLGLCMRRAGSTV